MAQKNYAFLDGMNNEALKSEIISHIESYGIDDDLINLIQFLPVRNKEKFATWRANQDYAEELMTQFLSGLNDNMKRNLVRYLEDENYVMADQLSECIPDENMRAYRHYVAAIRANNTAATTSKNLSDSLGSTTFSFLDGEDDNTKNMLTGLINQGDMEKADQLASVLLSPPNQKAYQQWKQPYTQPPPNLDWNSYGTSTSDSKTPLTPMLPNKKIPPAPPLPLLFAQPPLNLDLNIYETPTSESKASPDPLASSQTRPSPPPQDSKPSSSSRVATRIPRQESQNEEIMRLALAHENRRKRLESLAPNNQQQAGRVENISGTHVKAGGRPLVPQKSSIYDAMHENMKDRRKNIKDDSDTEDHMANTEFDSI